VRPSPAQPRDDMGRDARGDGGTTNRQTKLTFIKFPMDVFEHDLDSMM
jgi:hypothetical protein